MGISDLNVAGIANLKRGGSQELSASIRYDCDVFCAIMPI